MQIDVSVDTCMMRLHGRFDYSVHGEFLKRAESFVAEAVAPQVRIDMGQLDYIDSSGLGMLLMMRDLAKRHDKTMTLTNVKGYVRQVIDNAQFSRLFDIS